jgi:hypothetical protein
VKAGADDGHGEAVRKERCGRACRGTVVCPQPASADDAAAQLSAHLTGGDQRAWVKERGDIVLAVEEMGCVKGEIWVFEVDGGGTARICQNGRAEERPLVWVPAGIHDGLPVLELDGTSYVVDVRQQQASLPGESPVLISILRTLRTSQSEPVMEIRLEFRPR